MCCVMGGMCVYCLCVCVLGGLFIFFGSAAFILCGVAGVQLDTSPIARGYRKLFRAIRIFAFVARLAIRKDGHFAVMLRGITIL